MTEDELLTVDEIAAELRVSRMTIYRLVHAGTIPSIRVGRSFRVYRTALTAYLNGPA